jgi:hypothetical protein
MVMATPTVELKRRFALYDLSKFFNDFIRNKRAICAIDINQLSLNKKSRCVWSNGKCFSRRIEWSRSSIPGMTMLFLLCFCFLPIRSI